MKRIRLFICFFYLPLLLLGQELVPGDGVRLTFFNVSQEITGDYFIQQENVVQLPYVGLISLENKDYNILKNEITSRYDSLYRGVELIISPLYKINVLGEVRRPGVYFVTGVEKLLDVIALAGGETEDSDMSEILVQRKAETMVFDAEEIISEGADTDFFLKSGDRIYVTRKWWVAGQNTAFLFTAAGLVVTLIALFSK